MWEGGDFQLCVISADPGRSMNTEVGVERLQWKTFADMTQAIFGEEMLKNQYFDPQWNADKTFCSWPKDAEQLRCGTERKSERNLSGRRSVSVCRPIGDRQGTNIISQAFAVPHSSGAVWESRWPSWAVRTNEPSGFRGRTAILNHASALVSACP